jgi:hypothetical protein
MTEANQNESFTARTESQLLPTSEAHSESKKMTAAQSAEVNQTKSAVLQGQPSISNLKSQN